MTAASATLRCRTSTEADGNWGVVVPTANVTQSLAAMIMIAAVIALVVIAFVAVFMAGLIGKMLAPIQMLKQFASGDFSESMVVEKAIPRAYKNETEQIRTATTEVRQQIREIILNTKKDAENIGMIAEGTSAKNDGIKPGDIRYLRAGHQGDGADTAGARADRQHQK